MFKFLLLQSQEIADLLSKIQKWEKEGGIKCHNWKTFTYTLKFEALNVSYKRSLHIYILE